MNGVGARGGVPARPDGAKAQASGLSAAHGRALDNATVSQAGRPAPGL